jgi:NADPH:quinone reductase
VHFNKYRPCETIKGVFMRGIQVAQFGAPDVLVPVDIPDPMAGPGEAVIDVAAADVLFVDAMIRSGLATEFFPLRPPYIPGGGVAGTVLSIGPDTAGSWTGRRVVAHTGGNGGSGGYAQRALVAADDLVPIPDDLGLLEAAALLHDGATASGLVECLPIQPKEWVLVVGASGGLGALLVQLASAAGGRVIGAARGQTKRNLAREVGADLVVDDSDPDWPKQVIEATEGHGADLVFDNVGGAVGLAAFEAIATGGRFSAHGAPAGGFTAIDPTEAARLGVIMRGIEQVQFSPSDLVRLTRKTLAEAAEGLIRPIIGQTFPLEQAADAHRAIEARTVIGKTLLVI